MAAWTHSNSWDAAVYQNYRNFVAVTAPTYKGRTEDCADLTLELLIEFAATNGLCVTLEDNSGVRYISKAPEQNPKAGYFGTNLTWTSKDQFLKSVQQRIGAKALFNHNTVPNRHGPMPGDLLISTGHAALVFAYYQSGWTHPKAGDTSIPDFPDPPEIAETQVNQLEYMRNRNYTPSVCRIDQIDAHVDYLNHRGSKKPQAELIYFASVEGMKKLGYEFRMYSPKVTANWSGWNGSGDPPPAFYH